MRKYLLLGLAILAISIILFIGYTTWWRGGRITSTLEEKLVPTAEHLLRKAAPTPYFIWEISPSPASTMKPGQRICIILAPGGLLEPDSPIGAYEIERVMHHTTRIVLNNYRVAVEDVDIPSPGGPLYLAGNGRATGLMSACFAPALKAGLHILEVQTSTSWWGMFGIGKRYSYQWVYRVK